VVYQIELANSHLMPEIAVAFVEMLIVLLVLSQFSKNRRSSSKWQHFCSSVCQNPTFFMLEK
jgi:hypothetical protein